MASARAPAPATRARQSASRSASVCSSGMLRLPAGGRPEPRRVADQRGHVRGAQPLRVHAHLDRGARAREQQVEQVADADARGRCRRCRPRPASPFSSEQPVGAHHVAHVGEVAHRLEVADLRAPAAAGPASISAIWRANELSAKASPRPGPVWWKVRVSTTRMPPARAVLAARGRPAPPCSPRRARPGAAAPSSRIGSSPRRDRRRTPRRCPPPAPRAAAPRRRAASSRCTMPSTFVRSVPPGSSHDWWTLDWPARWTMRVGPHRLDRRAAAAAGSSRSASMDARARRGAPRPGCRAAARRRGPRPRAPRGAGSSTRWPPTKPPAPVTSSLTGSPRAPGAAVDVLAQEVADRAHVGELEVEAPLLLVAAVPVVADVLDREAAALHGVAQLAARLPQDVVRRGRSRPSPRGTGASGRARRPRCRAGCARATVALRRVLREAHRRATSRRQRGARGPFRFAEDAAACGAA